MRACAEMGVSPDVSLCGECGDDGAESYYFDVLNGNTVCRKCLLSEEEKIKNGLSAAKGGEYLPMSKSVAVAVSYVETVGPESLFSFNLTDDSFGMFYTLCEKYLLNQVGRSFVTLELYNEQIKT